MSDGLLQNGRILQLMQETQTFRPFSPAVSGSSPRQSAHFGKMAKRQFLAAAQSRLTMDWPAVNLSNDEQLTRNLRALRGRSRWLADNNGYYMRYIGMCTMNIVGPSGVRLESKVLKSNGIDADTAANMQIELAWREWSKKGVCTRRSKFTRVDLERIIIGSVVRDGEVLIRKWFGYGPHGYQLELIDPMRLPVDLNKTIDNRTEIINGIEYVDGDVSAYYIGKRGMKCDYDATQAERVPARFIEHLFFPLWPEQKRGFPWLASGMQRLHMMDRYENAEVIAARVAAENGGGFFKTSAAVEGDGFTGDSEDDGEAEIEYMESEAGSFGKLPEGWEFQQFDPKHPTNAFEALHSKLLRGIAAAGNVPYFSFANDLGDVNYSSARVGILEVRDNWQEKQNWLVSWLHEIIYPEWLRMSVTTGALNLSPSDLWRYQRVSWAPRAWNWVDPEKEAKGNLQKVKMGSASLSDIAAEQGKEFEEVVEQLARDKAMLEAAGISLTDVFGESSTGPDAPPPAAGRAQDLIRRIEELERRLSGMNINGHRYAETLS